MTLTPSLLDALQSTAGASPAGSSPSFNVLLLSKALWSVSAGALVTVILAARAMLRLNRGDPEEHALARSTIDASLFWGAFTFGVGVLPTLVGLISKSVATAA